MKVQVNHVTLSGNLTRDPEFRATNNGKNVARFTIAVSCGWGEQKTTMFLDCTAWERTAETARDYLHKGSHVLIEGRLQQEEWTDKTSGEARKKIACTVMAIHLMPKSSADSPREPASEPERRPAPAPSYTPPASPPQTEDDLPF